MVFLRKWLAQIRILMADLTISQRLLLGTLALMIPMLMWFVWQYAGTPDMVPILGDQRLTSQQRLQITSYLASRNIPYDTQGNQLQVPQAKRIEVLAALQMESLLPEDFSEGFESLIQNTTWWESSEQGRRRDVIARQGTLIRVIKAYPWVSKATVILSMPQQNVGFGRTHHRPTASVNIHTTGESLNQKRVDAIAGLVSGSVAEMQPSDVTVIDAVGGRQWKVRSEEEMMATDYMEASQRYERHYHEKIASALSYIPGVIVAVNVEMDIVRKSRTKRVFDKEGSVSIVQSEKTRQEEKKDQLGANEPGVRPNAGADITAVASAGGREASSSENATAFDTGKGEENIRSIDPGGQPERIGATISIPRSFFVAIYQKKNQPAEVDAAAGEANNTPPAEPTDAALAAVIDPFLERIQSQAQTLVQARNSGRVVVDVYPDVDLAAMGRGDMAMAGIGGGMLSQASMDYLLPLGLAGVAVIFMLMMVYKAGRKPQMPTAEELAGLPPKLETEDELIGEVAEDEMAMAGIEVDDSVVRSGQLTTQVTEMIQANPTDVAKLLQRWVSADE